MPEFILDTDNAPAEYEALSDIAKGFIECAFFQNQNTTGVAIGFDTEGHAHTRWLTMEEVIDLEDPQPIMAHWDHPEIQEALEQGQLDGDIPADCGVEHLAPETITKVREFCDSWYAANKADADAAAAIYGMDRVGNDLAYNIAGAGVGFWSRDELPEDLRDRLDATAGAGELNAFYQDRKVYLEFYSR